MSDQDRDHRGPTAVEQRLDRFAVHGDRIAFRVDNDRGRTDWTYRDLLDRTYREARRLDGLGVGRGDVVAVLTGDDPLTYVLRWAVNVLGAAAVVVPDGLAPAAVAEILTFSAARTLLVDSRRHALGAAATELVSTTDEVDVDSGAPPRDASPVAVRIRPDDLAWIRLTGGSTGTPKGVPRRADFLTSGDPDAFSGWRDAVDLLVTPVAHLAGTLAEVVLAGGGRVVLQSPFDPGTALAAIAREGVTWTALMPRLLHQMLDHPDLPVIDTSSLHGITLGSAPVSPYRLSQAIERFGPIISVGYGTLEVTSISSLSPDELRRPELRSTVGRPLASVEVSLRDDQDREVPTGQVGEILVRSHAVMPGYVGDPEQTAAAVTDGWFRTGDLGRLDHDGYLTVVGRLKDVIFAEHARIYPAEVEETLLRHPAVAAAAVFGIADDDGTETAHAAVVARPGRRPEPADLVEWVRGERGRNVAPSAVHVLDRFPTTPSGKVDRRALGARFAGA